MPKLFLLRFIGFIWLACVSLSSWADYTTHPEFVKFSADMQQRYQFSQADLMRWFSQANKQDAIIAAISKPAEQSKTWGDYRKIFITPQRTGQGIIFWKKHQATLKKASQTYQVPESIIVAIIGVETFYGRNTGKHRVIDALATLAFDYPPRADFFRTELAEFLLLSRENHLDPLQATGSYAGAMGYSQFISSSYRNYAVDMNDDKIVDLHNPQDAIGSVANYFQKNGWKPNTLVVLPATVTPEDNFTTATYTAEKPSLSLSELQKKGIQSATANTLDPSTPATLLVLQGEQNKEYWLGFKNFYVITRYNRSPLYAMAVYQLSQQLEASMMKNAPTPPSYRYHKYNHI